MYFLVIYSLLDNSFSALKVQQIEASTFIVRALYLIASLGFFCSPPSSANWLNKPQPCSAERILGAVGLSMWQADMSS